MSLPFGQLAGYTLVRRLGRPGGFGAAFEAREDGNRYVVKIFHAKLAENVDCERFHREQSSSSPRAARPSSPLPGPRVRETPLGSSLGQRQPATGAARSSSASSSIVIDGAQARPGMPARRLDVVARSSG